MLTKKERIRYALVVITLNILINTCTW